MDLKGEIAKIKFSKMTDKEKRNLVIGHNIIVLLRFIVLVFLNVLIFKSRAKICIVLTIAYPLLDLYELFVAIVLREQVRFKEDLFSLINEFLYNPLIFGLLLAQVVGAFLVNYYI